MPDQYDASAGARILICEDEFLVAEDVALTLRDLGYETAGMVATGEDAIRSAEDVRPDLILMDINLAGEIDGIEAVEQIRAQFDIPVVYLTAYAEEDVFERAKQTEPYGYLGKPVGLLELRCTVETALYKHQADRRVRESEERFRKVFEQGPIGMGLVGTDGRFFVVNSQLCQMLGYTEDELTRLTFVDITHPDHVTQDLEAVRRLYAGEIPYYKAEKRYIKKDGDILWGNLTAAAIRDAEGKLLYTLPMIEDITDRKRAEEALRESEDRYRDLVENIQDLICTHDLHGNLLFVNQAPAKLLGYAPADMVGTNLRSYLTPEVRDQLDAYLTAIRRDGQARGLMLVQAKSGEKRIWEYHNTLRTEGVADPTVRGIARDITDQRRAEAMLKASEQRLTLALAGANLGIWEWDLTTGKALWDERTLLVLGYELSEFEPDLKNWKRLIHPEDWARVSENLNLHIEGKLPMFEAEYRILNKSGDWQWVQGRGKSIRFDADGKPIRMAGVVADITDRKKAEEALRESERKFRETVTYLDEGYYSCTLDGTLLEHNRAFNQILGLEISRDLTGTSLPDFWRNPNDRAEYLNELMGKEIIRNYPINAKSATGERLVVMANAHLVKDENKGPVRIQGTFTDITDLKKAEETLREIKEELQAVIHASPVSIVVYDRDSIVKLWNPASEKIFGWSATEAIGKFLPFIPEDKIEEHIGFRERAFQGERLSGIEARRKRKDGSSIDVRGSTAPLHDSEGRIASVMAVFMDVTESKRAEEALRESRERLQTIFETSPAGIILVNSEGRITFANRKMGDLFSRPCADLLGTPYVDLVHPEQRSIGHGMMRSLMGGEIDHVSLERRYQAADGREFLGHLSGRRILREDGTLEGLVGIITDITDRKAAEVSLHESMELMQYIVRNDPNAIAVYDRDLHYLAVSSRYLLDYNVKEEDIIGKHHYEVFPEMPQRWKDVHQRCLLGAVERQDDDYFERPDGSVTYNRWECRPWYRSSGEIGGIITYTEVTTERKMAEKALKESVAKYRHLFNNSPVGIISVDTEGRILEVNQPLLDILDSPSPEAAKGTNIFEQSQLVESGVSDVFRACTTTGERVLKEFPYVSKWCKQSYLRIVLTPVTDQEGTIRGCQATVEDTTQQRALEEQLRQAQKMEAVGTLAGGIAHDFNNLLHIIAGHAELLEMELAEKDKKFGELDAIRQSAYRGADLVKQILTFSRKIDAKFESINLNEEVRSTERLLYRTIPKMIEIDLRLDEGLDRVRADSTQIEQMLINLAVNAKDAMPEGGRLAIETRNVNLDEHYCKSHAEIVPGQYVLLKVSDTGHGMEEDVRQHIFEPFFTTKGLADGTGLGLATVFGMVKMHGGHITCESEVGKGTTFLIYFPAVEAAKPEVVGQQEVTEVAGGTETILVVDDEPMIRDLAKRILDRSGYSVLTAGSGKEGIEIYAQHKSDIALVILDLIMPEMGGKQCLEELLKIDPQVKALIASGFAIKGDTKSFLDSEAKGTVSKPFNMRELLRAVRHVLDGV